MNNINLSIKICGLVFKTPLIAGSGALMYGFAQQKWDNPELWGGIVTKGLTYQPHVGNALPNMIKLPVGWINSVGLQNPGWKYFESDLGPKLNSLDTNKIININGFNQEDYIKLAKAVNDSPFGDAIELNISCPNIDSGGLEFGVSPESAFMITKAVRAVITKKPLIVKLTAQTSDLVAIAQAVEKAGADVISLINTIPAMVIDIHSQKPSLGGIKGGLSGRPIKPIGVKAVYDVFDAVKIPIIGIGGVSCGEDVIEYMLAGAHLVQVGTALQDNPRLRSQIEHFITQYLKKHNFDSPTELIGKAHVHE